MKYYKNNIDLFKTIILSVSIFIVIIASFYVIRPFIQSFFWASIIVISTWPILLYIQNFFGNKKYLSIFFMVFFLLLSFFIPFFIIISSVFNNSFYLISYISLEKCVFPNLDFLQSIPIFGLKFSLFYKNLIQGESKNIFNYLQPYLGQIMIFLLCKIKLLSHLLMNLFFIFIFICFLYWKGEKICDIFKNFFLKLNFKPKNSIFLIIEKSIRAVFLGVVITSLIQGALGGLALIIVGAPYIIFFVMLIIFFSLIQLGSLPILIPIVLWLFLKNYFIYGIFLLIWSIILSILDNLIRFMFIRLGINLPFFFIFSGIIGGLLAFGMIGLFIGPVVLDIFYRVFQIFVNKRYYSKNIIQDTNITKK
ncbi:Putative transport protein YdiK [Buchnera aphidicola (Chaitophorus populicola)]|uniref:AI-2E family transporter YdiK n=1 Tax=Buchnera aphidicola TaxID=9 RepID=UPI003464DBCD